MAQSQTDIESALYNVFESFAAFGDRDSAAQLDSFRFAKLLRETGVIDNRSFSLSNADIVFSKAKQRSARTLTFDDFIVALGLVAELKYPTDPEGFSRVVDAIMHCQGPMVVTSVAPGQQPSGIFAKLTDPRLYTGSHVHRFDPATGRGKGLAGRDVITTGRGTVDILQEGQPISDLSQLLRPSMRGGTHISSEEARRRRQQAPQVRPEYSPRRAPPSSSHAGSGSAPSSPGSPSGSRVKEHGAYYYPSPSPNGSANGSARYGGSSALGSPSRGSVSGGGFPASPMTSPQPPKLRVSAVPAALAGGGAGGDGGDIGQLQAIFDAYCLFGTTGATGREGEMTSQAFSKMMKESGVVGPVSQGRLPPAAVDVAYAKARGPDRNKRTITYDQFLYALQLLAVEMYPDAADTDPLAATAALAGLIVSAGGPALNVSVPVAEVVAASALGSASGGMPSVFAKLTDSRLYTGSHVHRFDESGRGRGKAGRTHVPGLDDHDE